ncbi:MAG: GNAT family protein [Pseudomonadota bacterium]
MDDLSQWTPRERPGLVALEGRRVRLEPLDWAPHADGLFEAVDGPGNEGLWTYMPFGPFGTLDAFSQAFEHLRRSQGWETLVIRSSLDGAILGTASYLRIREAHGSCEVGCVAFGQRLQRTAEATEAMALMAAHAFNDLGYRRYEWKCNNANLASRRAADRLGFAFEGVFRNDMVVKGENRDTAWYAMIDADWPAISAALSAWLDPANFDETGAQRRPLGNMRAEGWTPVPFGETIAP